MPPAATSPGGGEGEDEVRRREEKGFRTERSWGELLKFPEEGREGKGEGEGERE